MSRERIDVRFWANNIGTPALPRIADID